MAYTRITAPELEALLQAGTALSLLDARDPLSHRQAHLDGARLLDRDSLDRMLVGLPRELPVVIYCYHGNSSQVYAGMFEDFRFAQVHDLVGGWEAWERHRLQRGLTPTSVGPADPMPPVDGPSVTPPPPAVAAWMMSRGYRGDDLHERLANRSTALMQAAREGDAAAVAGLLAAGAEVDAVNADGNTALWLACFAEQPEALDALLAAGADVNHANDNGATCLMYASSAGKAEVVRRLLRAGADITLRSLDDYTALDMASTLDCLRLLREAERRALASRPADL